MQNPQLQVIVNQFLGLVQKGQFMQAKPYTEMPAIKQVNDPRVIQARAITSLNLGHELPARDAFLELLAFAQDQHGIHNVVADLSAKLNDFDLADRHFRKATSLAPNVHQYWFNWGLCENVKLNFTQANDYFLKALNIDSNYVKARFEYAKGLIQLAEFSLAQEQFEQLINNGKNEHNWKWHFYYAQCFECLSNIPAAQCQYLKAIELNSKEYVLYEALALNYLSLKQNQDALHCLENGIKHLPSSAILHSLLANLRHEMGHEEPLLSYRLTEKKHITAEMKRDQIASLITQNELGLAKELLASEKTNQNNYDVFSGLRCDIAIKEHKFEQALSLLPKTITESNPGFKKVTLVALLSQFGLGDYKAAGKNIDKLLKLEPLNQYYWALKSTELKLSKHDLYTQLMKFDQLLSYGEISIGEEYASIADFNEQLLAVLAPLHNTVQSPLLQSGVGGTQTPGYLFQHKNKVLQDLKVYLRNAAKMHFAKLDKFADSEHPVLSRYSESIDLVTAWSMWLKSGGFHQAHCHPKGWFSSAYYVQTPKSIDGNSSAGHITFGTPGLYTYDKLEADCSFVPKEGHLALFPSFYWHNTEPFSDTKARVSVAFDILPT